MSIIHPGFSLAGDCDPGVVTLTDVAANLERIGQRMATACARVDRDPQSVRLVAVSKRIDLDLVVDACRAGQWDFGENRVADALARQDELAARLSTAGLPAERVVWHFIGHLQRNKANKAAGRFALLHGVESLDLAEKLDRRAQEESRREPLLVEVNVTGEDRKNGVAPEQVTAFLIDLVGRDGIDPRGLMCMGRYGADENELRTTFDGLRRLRDEARTATGLDLPELSMGMSGDFETAIAAGATLIRVGTAIFGHRTY